MGIVTKIKELDRLRQVVNILFEEGFGYLIEKTKLKTHLFFHKRVNRKKFSETPSSKDMPKRIRISMEKLGGSFVKLGQLLSLRPDLISKEYIEEFSRLQDNVKEVPYDDVVDIIEEEYGKKLKRVFLKFEKKPIASASVSQVHKAWLKNGKKVAVKIQRPLIEDIFETDISLLKDLAGLIERHYPELKVINPRKLIKEFENYSKKELDFTIEARNIEVFYNNFKSDKNVVIPEVYKKYSNKRILVAEFIDGDKLTEIKDDSKFKLHKKNIVNSVSNSYLKQLFVFNTFHADLHPGNILFLKYNKIALLDFGIVGHISHDLKEKVENLFISLVSADRVMLAESMIGLGFVKNDVNVEEFKNDLSEHLSQYYAAGLADIAIGNVLYDLITIARKYEIDYPQNFILFVKSMITIDGFVKEYYPEYDYMKYWKIYMNKILRKRKDPDHIISAVKENAFELRNFITDLPNNFKRFLNSKENHKIQLDQRNIEQIEDSVNKSMSKVTYGLIIAALILSSAFMLTKEAKNSIFGIPLASVIFLMLAILLFLVFLSSRNLKKGG